MCGSNFVHENVGMLCVFYDELHKPLFCVFLDITSLLRLLGGTAYVGFTASTGMTWQIHDILSWRFCETNNCV